MAARRKKETDVVDTLSPLPVARPRKRFYMQKMADGVGERAVRVSSARQSAKEQVLADFFCGGTELPVSSNQRSMDSLLGELLSELHIEEDNMAPELLAEAWREAVGDALASFSSLVSVSRGKARVVVAHPTVRYEITRLKSQVIKALNNTLGSGSVKSLIIASS